MNPSLKNIESFSFTANEQPQMSPKFKKIDFQCLTNKNIQCYNRKYDHHYSQKEKGCNNRFMYYKIPDYDSTNNRKLLDPKQLKIPSNNCYFKVMKNNNNSIKKLRNNQIHNIYSGNHDKMYLNCSCKLVHQNKSINSSIDRNNLTKKEKNFISNLTPIFKKVYNNNDNNNNYNINSISDKLTKIWNDLCILNSYRKLFNIILDQLDEDKKNYIIQKEISELSELKTNLIYLSFSVKQRIEVLEEIDNLNDKLGIVLKNEFNDSSEEVIKNISNKIQKLRNYTIDICFTMKKIKEYTQSVHSCGKFNLDILGNKYKFDKNYLIKMKEEMFVLREGYSKYFFNIGEDQTPFLLNASNQIENNQKNDPLIHVVPLSLEQKENIYQCMYYIYQELISYQNKNIQNNNFKNISPLKRYTYEHKSKIVIKSKNKGNAWINDNKLFLNKIFNKYNDTSYKKENTIISNGNNNNAINNNINDNNNNEKYNNDNNDKNNDIVEKKSDENINEICNIIDDESKEKIFKEKNEININNINIKGNENLDENIKNRNDDCSKEKGNNVNKLNEEGNDKNNKHEENPIEKGDKEIKEKKERKDKNENNDEKAEKEEKVEKKEIYNNFYIENSPEKQVNNSNNNYENMKNDKAVNDNNENNNSNIIEDKKNFNNINVNNHNIRSDICHNDNLNNDKNKNNNNENKEVNETYDKIKIDEKIKEGNIKNSTNSINNKINESNDNYRENLNGNKNIDNKNINEVNNISLEENNIINEKNIKNQKSKDGFLNEMKDNTNISNNNISNRENIIDNNQMKKKNKYNVETNVIENNKNENIKGNDKENNKENSIDNYKNNDNYEKNNRKDDNNIENKVEYEKDNINNIKKQ